MEDKQLLLSNQICFPLYSASRLITKAYKPYLDELGLTYPQYLVLMVLWENEELSVSQIKEKLYLDTNTLSPLLKRMEKMKLLKRNRSIKDERSVIVQLTDNGRELKAKACPIPEKLFTQLVSETIKVDDMMKLKDILDELISVLTNKKEVSTKT